jgi:hypothetical protein
MSTDLMTIDTGDFSFEQMAAMLGQASGGEGGDGLTRLRINTDFEDDDGNPKPGGHWVISQGGKEVFAKKVKLRPFSQKYFYQKYDPEDKKVTNKTIYFADFRIEAIDEKGTVRCGRPDSKTLKAMSDEQKKRYKDIKARRAVFGLVTFVDPVNADGTAAEPVENVPVEWVSGGVSWNLVQAVFDEMTKKKFLMIQTEMVIGLKREKAGQTVYYTPQIEVDWAAPKMPMDKVVVETFTEFERIIAARNEDVKAKHKEALRTANKAVVVEDDLEVVEDVLAGDFDDELNDEIPL